MITLEVIANTVDDCLAAQAGGANRIELCSALALGGLTPSLGLLVEARRQTHLPIMYMLRPRAGGFCYTQSEFAVMLRDGELALAHGADGLVFGCLHMDGSVDSARIRQLVELAGDKETVFHRAFDVVPDVELVLGQLIALGVTRILTSGQRATAEQGAVSIAHYIEQVAGRIQILPGGGVRLENVCELLQATGATQVHTSLSGYRVDLSTSANPELRFGPTAPLDEHQVRYTDVHAVAKMRARLDA